MLSQTFAVVALAALIAGAVLQVVLALAGYGARRADREAAALARSLRQEVLTLHGELAETRRRLADVERRGAVAAPAAAKPVPVMMTEPAIPARREVADPAYELAAKLVRKGANERELMDTCGLSRGEVDLIATLNRNEASRTAAHA